MTTPPLRPVAAFDIDGTLMRRQLIELLTEEFFRRGIFTPKRRAEFEELTLHQRDRRISYRDFDTKLVEMYLEGIRGLSVDVVETVSRYIAKHYNEYTYTFTQELVQLLGKTHQCIAITGANEHVLRHLSPFWRFERYYGSVLEVLHGVYTGNEIEIPVLAKNEALHAHIALGCVSLSGSVGVGDTASDIVMLHEVTYPVAFNPDFELRAAAAAHHWPVVWEKKTTIEVVCCSHTAFFHRDEAAKAVAHVVGLRTCECPV